MTEAGGESDACLVSCNGLYADIQHINATQDFDQLTSIIKQYNEHKSLYAKNLGFDPSSDSFSKLVLVLHYFLLLLRQFSYLQPTVS